MVIGYSNGTAYESEAHEVADQPMMTDEYQTDVFDTYLPPDKEEEYRKHFGPQDSNDYDMRGYMDTQQLKEILDRNPDAHFPDTFKKPSHPTFSNESKFHGDMYEGGNWDKLEDGSYTFTPGKENLRRFETQELIDYFKKNEKGNKLILPGS